MKRPTVRLGGNPAHTWGKVDNDPSPLKEEIRRQFLPESASVLDLHCGLGKMYREAYEGRVAYYHGIDNTKVFDPRICTIQDNSAYVMANDISRYDVFDIDAYGCPWQLFYRVMQKAKQPRITAFLTDGAVIPRSSVSSHITLLQSAIEHLPRSFAVPGLRRWYIPMVATMLRDVEKRFGYRTVRASWTLNEKGTVYFWVVILDSVRETS